MDRWRRLLGRIATADPAPDGLKPRLEARIRRDGPLPLADWMAACVQHYYGTRDPLGAAGDFITAPEISQMFGELIGLWCAEAWQRLGAPAPIRLVELGPGRGTLMRDALRAVGKVAPGFAAALDLHLVETSPVLRRAQAGLPATWHDHLDTVPPGPALVVANEFFDALPVEQLVRTDQWRLRRVGLGGFVAGEPIALPRDAPPGSVAERRPAGAAIARQLAERGGVALVIDYGYVGPALGDTLQAVRRHRFHPVLEDPGEADLTAHVDFGALAEAARAAGGTAHGPVPQGTFLRRLGIVERAARLDRPEELARLIEPAAMGRLFRVLGLAPPGLNLPGFE